MDYASMSILELKQHAKELHIKQYYILKRAELIRLLSMDILPESYRIEKMTIHQLRDQAKQAGIRRIWALSRAQLVELLFPEYYNGKTNQAAADKNQKDEGDADKHNDPQ
jgi:hypothetical protein